MHGDPGVTPDAAGPVAASGTPSMAIDPVPALPIDLAAVLDQLSDAILVADDAGVVRLANPAAAKLFGYEQETLVSMPLVDLMPERFRQAHADAFSRFMSTGTARVIGGHAIPVMVLRADGTEAEVDLGLGSVAAGGTTFALGTLRDAAEARAELTAQLRAAQRSQTFLLRVTEVLARAYGYAQTIEQLAAVAVPAMADLCLVDVLSEDGRLVRLAARHADESRQPLADELRRRYGPDAAGTHPSAGVLATGTAQWAPDISEEFLRATTQDDHHLELVQTLDFTSYISVPLIANDEILGVVSLVSAGSGRRFGAEDLALAEEFAGRVALVVAKAQRADAEHQVSSTLQASLLPDAIPTLPDVDVAVRYLPSTRDLEVGGDFYDVLPSDDAVTFIVGDVAGHDSGAAAMMGQLRTACRAFATQASGPAELLTLVQQNWHQLGLRRIATAVVVRLDRTTGDLRIASAGHPPPVLVDVGSTVFVPVDPAPPLGASTDTVTEWVGRLPPGAALLCYTDGLVEDRHQSIDVGTAQLLAAARQAPPVNVEQLCDQVLVAMTGGDRNDDVAVLAVTRR